MGCCQGGARKVQYSDSDGRLHVLELRDGKLVHGSDQGAPVPVSAIALRRGSRGGELRDTSLGWARLSPAQLHTLEDLAALAKVDVQELAAEDKAARQQSAAAFSPPPVEVPVFSTSEESFSPAQTVKAKAPAPSFQKSATKALGSGAVGSALAAAATVPVANSESEHRFRDLAPEAVQLDELDSLPDEGYCVDDWVNVWSVSRSRWLRAQVIKVENCLVTVSYKSPDGPKEKSLPEDHEFLRRAKPNEQGPESAWIVMGRYTMYMDDEHIMGEGSSSICRRGVDNATGRALAIKVYKATPDFVDVQGGMMAEDAQEDWEAVTMQKYSRQIQVLQDLMQPLVEPAEKSLWCQDLDALPAESLFMQLVDYSKDAAGNPSVDPDDGLLYVITELAEYSLLDYLNDKFDKGEYLTPEIVKSLTHSICLIVAGLHSKGYVHLDLKPENLMVFDGCLKLIDVDGCMRIGSEVSLLDPSLSCSPVYCAPEWAEFCLDDAEDPLVHMRPHFDVWSVGITICELVTLEPILLNQYKEFLDMGADVANLFMGWLAKQEVAPIPDCIRDFDPLLADFLLEALLVCDATCRHTAAQALSHPYFESLHAESPDVAIRNTEMSLPSVLPKEAPSKHRREAQPESHVLHKGNVFMLEPGGNINEPKDWRGIDLWLTRSASMSYFRLEDDLIHQVLGGRHIKQAILLVTSAETFTFELRWPDNGSSVSFQCESEADFAGWIAAIKEAKSGLALSMNFGHHLKHLRVKNKFSRPMSATNSRTPVFTDTLFVLRSGGDRAAEKDWLEYEMWMAKNGSLQYWDSTHDAEVTLCTPRDLRSAAVKKLSAGQGCKPWGFQLAVEGANMPPLELAASTKAARENWVREIRNRQQLLGVLPPMREHLVGVEVMRLGMEFQSGPPDSALVSIVKPGMWAQSVNVCPGDEVLELNDIAVKDMSFSEFTSTLQQRPLKIAFALPRQDDVAHGAKFSKLNTVQAKKPKAAPKKKLSKFAASKGKPVPAG